MPIRKQNLDRKFERLLNFFLSDSESGRLFEVATGSMGVVPRLPESLESLISLELDSTESSLTIPK